MLTLSALAYPFSIGFIATFVASLLIALTKPWHGAFSLDHVSGVQKFHKTPTPRIGGLALVAGYGAAAITLPASLRSLFFTVAASALFAFSAGVIEDFSKNVHSAFRFVATILSGVAFCLLTGYAVTRLEIPFVDPLLAIPLLATAFTSFAMAGGTNAMNIIDGFNGLATGTTIILLAAFATVSVMAGDHDMTLFCLLLIGVALGFLLINFPFGHVFLGDGGAYFLGFVLASVAVMVPARNPDVSPWISVVILAYPVLEVVFSVVRKIRRGTKPYEPDGLHLHMLVYRRLERIIPKITGNERLANPAVSVLLWGGPATSLVLVALIPHSRNWSLLAMALLSLLYALSYRMAASRRPGVSRDSATGFSQRDAGATSVDESSGVPG